jgi:hypothetical protein
VLQNSWTKSYTLQERVPYTHTINGKSLKKTNKTIRIVRFDYVSIGRSIVISKLLPMVVIIKNQLEVIVKVVD